MPRSPGKLPVLKIVAASYGFVLLNARDLLRVVWLPFIALSVLDIFLIVNAPASTPGDGGVPPLGISDLFAVAAEIFVTITVLVAWYRRVLLGPEGLPPGFPLALGAREGLFFGRSLGILFVLLTVLVFAAPGLVMLAEQGSAATRVVGFAGLAGIALAEAYLANRLLLVLPATAIDERFGYGDAWRASAGNGWRMALAWFLTILPVAFIELAMIWVWTSLESRELLIGIAIAMNALELLDLALGATVLSLCFTQLRTRRDDEEAAY